MRPAHSWSCSSWAPQLFWPASGPVFPVMAAAPACLARDYAVVCEDVAGPIVTADVAVLIEQDPIVCLSILVADVAGELVVGAAVYVEAGRGCPDHDVAVHGRVARAVIEIDAAPVRPVARNVTDVVIIDLDPRGSRG